MGGSPHCKRPPHPTKFGGHRHCGSGDINIPANTVILLQMWDIRCYICSLTSAVITFCKARPSCVTPILNSKLMNNIYVNSF